MGIMQILKKNKNRSGRVDSSTTINHKPAYRSGRLQATNYSAGFTLVETLVAIFIFAIVMTVASGAILNIISVNRKAQSLKSVMNNLNFAIEAMSREIRFGESYQCSSALPSPCTGVSFTRGTKDTNYYLDSGQIKKKTVDGGVTKIVTLTSADVNISKLEFDVVGATTQRVFVLLEGQVMSKGQVFTSFNMQTTVSSRAI